MVPVRKSVVSAPLLGAVVVCTNLVGLAAFMGYCCERAYAARVGRIGVCMARTQAGELVSVLCLGSAVAEYWWGPYRLCAEPHAKHADMVQSSSTAK